MTFMATEKATPGSGRRKLRGELGRDPPRGNRNNRELLFIDVF